MTEKRRAYIKAYQRQWIANRRHAFFEAKRCAKCNGTDRLTLDRIDPSKPGDHAIWSWKESRRLAELDKFQVLCHDCHKQRSARHASVSQTGKPCPNIRRFSQEEANEIRRAVENGFTLRQVGFAYGVGHSSIYHIVSGDTYGE
jgi:hypothetical protein